MDPELGPSSDNIGTGCRNNHNTNTHYRRLFCDLARPWLCICIVSCLGLLLPPPPSQPYQRHHEGPVGAWLTPRVPSDPKQQQPQRILQWENAIYPGPCANYTIASQAEALPPPSTLTPTLTVSCPPPPSNVTTDTSSSRISSSHQHHHAIFDERHKDLLPLDHSDYLGLIAAMLGLLIAAGGGIGGGGILVPVFCLVMGFSPKHAIPLSNVTVFGGGIANVILNAGKRHPLADRPLVDWDLILVMEPLTIGGALVGAILNKILNELFLTLMLVALLSFTAYTTLEKAMSMYKKESAAIRLAQQSELTRLRQQQDDDDEGEATEKLLVKDGSPREPESDSKAVSAYEQQQQEQQQPQPASQEKHFSEIELPTASGVNSLVASELKQILQEERKTPEQNVRILVTLFAVVLAVNILKGGGAFPSPLGIRCGSFSFWTANAAMILLILVISVQCRTLLIRKHERKELVNYPYVEGDIKWDHRATIVYPILCSLAGFFAGMFGVGGGIVKGPLMLAMGVHPAVSSASSACMILFTSFTATTSFVVFGLLTFDYGSLFFVVGFVTTYIGQVAMSYLMKKNERNSYIAFSIGGVVLLSAVLMTIQSLLSIVAGERHHTGGICGKEG